MELARHGSWAADFREQIAVSALEICRKYLTDASHSTHVAALAQCILDALKDPDGELLRAAAELLNL